MAWYDEAIFYHIYPLGLSGAPKENAYEAPVHRLRDMKVWIDHIKEIGCNAIYIGPLFESVGHGYETTDYKKLDSRLGDNDDLKDFVQTCHTKGIRVILDGVFNHTGRDFFAFKDLKEHRENSRYKDWYCNVNFWGNTEYNDGFSYENWGGYNLLVKLNQHNPEVRDYICDVVRFWVSEFDIDGIRLDAADVLDFEYMKALRRVANEIKPDFWLMGEVIHGDYIRWANEDVLHSVTNYHLHKALYSGHNDHNYFEIAHTVKRLYEMGGNRPNGLKLYNFVDNHDVERIYTKLNKKAHFAPVHILLYTLPGIPSIYYGSEFGIEGKKERGSDDSLRPHLRLEEYDNSVIENPHMTLISQLGRIRQRVKALSYGDYREILLTNRQYAFARKYENIGVVVTVNNDDSDYNMTLPAGEWAEYVSALSGEKVMACDGMFTVTVNANSGDIWLPNVDELLMDVEEEINIADSTPVSEYQEAEEENVEELSHVERMMRERFLYHPVIALATMEGQRQHVRNVCAYYEEGVFYIITYSFSNKMKQIEMWPSVAVCGEWFTGHGIAENLGYIRDEKNVEISAKMHQAFASWYQSGYFNEDDPKTCILKISLTDGVLLDNGNRYELKY